MRAARSEYDAPSVRRADASDIGLQLLARYGQNDREIVLGRKNHLFAGSDGGGEHWAVIASLIETCKMNAVDPEAYLRDVLNKIVARHPMSRVDELLPFAYAQAAAKKAAA
jgi:IS66 C-terminal element